MHALSVYRIPNYRAFELQTWHMGDRSLRALPSAVASLDAHAEIQLVHAVKASELLDPVGTVGCVYDKD